MQPFMSCALTSASRERSKRTASLRPRRHASINDSLIFLILAFMRLLSYILNVCLSVQDLIAPFQIIIPSGLITLCIVSIQPSTVTVMPSAHESSGIDGVVQGVQNRAGCKGPFDARVYTRARSGIGRLAFALPCARRFIENAGSWT